MLSCFTFAYFVFFYCAVVVLISVFFLYILNRGNCYFFSSKTNKTARFYIKENCSIRCFNIKNRNMDYNRFSR